MKNNSTKGVFSFGNPLNLTGFTHSYMDYGDFDGDGKADIVSGDLNGSQIAVYRNTSSGGTISMAAAVISIPATTPAGVAVSDLDGDGNQILQLYWVTITWQCSEIPAAQEISVLLQRKIILPVPITVNICWPWEILITMEEHCAFSLAVSLSLFTSFFSFSFSCQFKIISALFVCKP